MTSWWERYHLREMRLGYVQAGSQVHLQHVCARIGIWLSYAWYQTQGMPDIVG